MSDPRCSQARLARRASRVVTSVESFGDQRQGCESSGRLADIADREPTRRLSGSRESIQPQTPPPVITPSRRRSNNTRSCRSDRVPRRSAEPVPVEPMMVSPSRSTTQRTPKRTPIQRAPVKKIVDTPVTAIGRSSRVSRATTRRASNNNGVIGGGLLVRGEHPILPPGRKPKAAEPKIELDEFPDIDNIGPSARIDELSDDHLDFYDSIHLAFYSDKINNDGYNMDKGAQNPIHEERRRATSRIKSGIPSKIVEPKFRSGFIDDIIEYMEMESYYRDKQAQLVGDSRDPRRLMQLEMKFYRTYPPRPQVEDFNYMGTYKAKAEEWIHNEEIRLQYGYSPFCSPQAMDLLPPMKIDPKWFAEHKAIVDQYEREYRNNINPIQRDIPEWIR